MSGANQTKSKQNEKKDDGADVIGLSIIYSGIFFVSNMTGEKCTRIFLSNLGKSAKCTPVISSVTFDINCAGI